MIFLEWVLGRLGMIMMCLGFVMGLIVVVIWVCSVDGVIFV